MKSFSFVLIAMLIIGIAVPMSQVSARSNNDMSRQDDSQSDYEDSSDDGDEDENEYEDEDSDEDENEYEDEDSDDDSYTQPSTSTSPVLSTNLEERIKLLQQLVTRLVALLNELKGISTPVTPITPAPVTPTPTPVTPAPAPVTQTYTNADVATHNTTASCWSIINSKVYDLTSYISRHPGGSQTIKGICGKDGTSAFNGQHGNASNPKNVLKGYYLAPLAQ